MWSLSDERVLVTGGTAGIGLAMARAFKAEGAEVWVCGRREGPLAAARAEGLRAVQADVATEVGRAALVDVAGGHLTVLVNNAASQQEMNFRDPDEDRRIEAELRLNLLAPMLLTEALLPALMAAPRAAVVNVTSGLALAPKAASPVYCASKAGLRSFSKALRAQLRETSVGVVEVLPPMVDTAMTAGRGTGKISPEQVATETLAGLLRGREEVRVGKVKLLGALLRVAPGVAERMMLGL